MSPARAGLAAVVLLVFAPAAFAQRYPGSGEPHLGSLEAGVGAAWVRGVDFGERRAEEMRNPTTGDSPLVLFVSRSQLAAVPGFQARFGVYLSRDFVAEAGLRYSRPQLRTEAMQDFELAADVVATETLSQYVFDGSLVFHLAHFSGGRVVPFVRGGAGQIRDLHERGELMQTGTEYHGGGGVKLWWGRIALRADLGVMSRSGGFDLGTSRRAAPTLDGTLTFRF